MSLLARLLCLVGLALLPVLAALVWGAWQAGEAREAAAREEALRIARMVATEQQRLADGARQLLTALGDPRAARVLDRSDCQRLFARAVADFPRYAVVGAATLDGSVVCASRPTAYGQDIADRGYFLRALEENRFVTGGLVLGRASGQNSFHFAQPFLDSEGRVTGVVYAAVRLDWLAEQLNRIPLPQNAVISIVDRDGMVLATRPGRAQRVADRIEGAAGGMLNRPEEGVEEARGVDGTLRLFAHVPAEAGGTHTVIVGLDYDALLGEAARVQRESALVLLGATLLALLLLLLGARRLIRRPVEHLLRAAERLRDGDGTARVEGPESPESEFGRLAVAFDAMAAAAEARERSLRESEAEFRAIFEAAAVGVARIDVREGRIERANGRFCEILGRDAPALLGASLCDGVHPSDAPAFRESLARLAAEGRITVEFRAVQEAGAVSWFRLHASTFGDPGDAPDHAVAALQDVTERRLGEEADARLAAIVASASDAIVSLSTEDGRITTWNRGAEALFGFTAAEAAGAPIDLLIPPGDDGGAFLSWIGAGGTIHDRETVRLTKRGACVPVAVTMAGMRAADGRLIGTSVVLRDLRERRAADQQQRLLMREVDHRARNVMAVVRSLVQLSPKTDPTAFARAIDGRISAMARAHGLLARDRWEGASLRDLAREELGGHAGGADGTARADLQGPPVLLRPDAVQPLSMVLHELVTNSARHGALSSEAGRVELGWWLDPTIGEAEPGLTIRWTERGGPRVEAPPARKGFGSRLIEINARHQLRGGVSLDWRPQGLVATIRIGTGCIAAAGLPAALATASPDPAPEPPGGDLDGARILVVEDEALVAVELADVLSGAGCRLFGPSATVADGFAQMERAGAVDAAVLDVNLGGEPVTALADALVARGVPVLFTTGYGEAPGSYRGALVLTKPVAPGDLLGALRRLVRARRPRREAAAAES